MLPSLKTVFMCYYMYVDVDEIDMVFRRKLTISTQVCPINETKENKCCPRFEALTLTVYKG